MVQKYTALEIAAISLIALRLISGCVRQKQQGEKTVPGDGEQNRITLEEVARVRKKTKW